MPGTIAIGGIHAYQSLATRIHACTQWDDVQCRHKSLNMNRQDVDTESFQDIVSLLLLRFHFSKSCSTHCQCEGWVANEFPRTGFVLFSSYLCCTVYAYEVCLSLCLRGAAKALVVSCPRDFQPSGGREWLAESLLRKWCKAQHCRKNAYGWILSD